MSQLFETFRCGNGEALVTFVYGESTPAEREAITTHVAQCAACADELAALGATRHQLAAWAPPDHALGFRITRTEGEAQSAPSIGAAVLRPTAWWSRPLPAWAQMAAAVLIFASGMALGGTWSSRPAEPTAPVPGVRPAATTVSTSAPSPVTRQDLAQIAQQLRAEIAQVRTTAPSDATPDTRAVMQRVSQMIAASEARQQNELELRTSQMVRDFTNTRRIDLTNIEKRLGMTTMRVQSNQQDINSLAQRVGYSPAYSPFAP